MSCCFSDCVCIFLCLYCGIDFIVSGHLLKRYCGELISVFFVLFLDNVYVWLTFTDCIVLLDDGG